MKKRSWLYFSLMLCFAFSSCKREQATRWNIDLEAPIAKGRLTVSDLVPEENISIDSDGLVHFILNENLTDFNLDSLLVIPDTSFIDHLSNNFAILTIGPGGLIIPPESGDALMDIPNVQIKELVAKSGLLQYKLKNFINGDLLATYALPKATLFGESILIEELLAPGTSENPSVLINNYDLTGYHFDLSGVNEDSFNQMFNLISLYVDPNSPTNVVIPTQDTIIKTEISFINPKVSYARGYFGQHEFNINEKVVLDQLSNIISGNLNIGEVEMQLRLENFAGIDAQIILNELTGKNTNTGNSISLIHDEIQNSINITRAIDNNGNVTPEVYEINLNESNSNIDEWLENLPDSLVTSTSISVNPLGDVSSGNDFIYTDQALQANLQMDLPLCVSLENIVFEDVLDVEIDLEQNIEGLLKIDLLNAFPLDGELSIDIIDEEGNSVYQLANNWNIATGNASDYFAVVASENQYEIVINEGMLNHLRNNAQIKVNIKLNSYQNDIVKFTSSNFIDVSIYLDAEVEISYE